MRAVTVLSGNGAVGKIVAAIFVSFGNAKVYMVGRDELRLKVARREVAASVCSSTVMDSLYSDFGITRSGQMRGHEYVRHGTLSLICGIDLLDGVAHPLVRPTHRSSDFVDFLRVLTAHYPEGDSIRIVLDNHSAHTSAETQGYYKKGRSGLFVYARLYKLISVMPHSTLGCKYPGGLGVGIRLSHPKISSSQTIRKSDHTAPFSTMSQSAQTNASR